MDINLYGLAYDSVVDGTGVRMTIFVQGCPHHCEGCHNQDSWEFKENDLVSIDSILEKIKNDSLLEGVTFSGGEPFCYVKELSCLAYRVHQLGLNVWCYTGYTYEQIMLNPNFKALIDQVDVLVDGRFEQNQKDLRLKFKGSSNQRIIDMKKTRQQQKIVLLDI